MKSILIGFVALLSATSIAASNDFTQGDYDQDTIAAKALVDTTEVSARYNYCSEGTLTCRTLVLLKDKSTGRVVSSIWDVFLSSERAVGSVGYFLAKENGKFRAILDRTMDGAVNIDLKFAENQDLTITFDRRGFPTVHNVALKRLGTTRYILADMSYNAKEAKIVGLELDEVDPTYRKPTTIIYKAVR